jgi:hypothetical protein
MISTDESDDGEREGHAKMTTNITSLRKMMFVVSAA